MSAEQSQLRTTLLGSLLDVTRRNLAQGAGTIRLFEAGSVYEPDPQTGLAHEPYHVGAVLIGPVRPPTWRDGDPRAADFFAAKGSLAGLLDTLRVPWGVRPQAHPFLHPGRSASIEVEGQEAGWLGEVHPQVAAEWEIDETVAAFELDLDLACRHALLTPVYEDVTTFPEAREDIAVVVAEDVSAERVLDVVRQAGAPLLQRATIFDVYHDPSRLGAGNYSLALRLSYRASDRTLTDAEVAERREAIIAAIAEQLGGRIRA
jgi:phenylalanyl-tRNA synthetase beta chain